MHTLHSFLIYDPHLIDVASRDGWADDITVFIAFFYETGGWDTPYIICLKIKTEQNKLNKTTGPETKEREKKKAWSRVWSCCIQTRMVNQLRVIENVLFRLIGACTNQLLCTHQSIWNTCSIVGEKYNSAAYSSHWFVPAYTIEHVFQFRIMAGYGSQKTVTYPYKYRIPGRLNPLANLRYQYIIFQYYNIFFSTLEQYSICQTLISVKAQ